jgi:putative methionine-R-sulfoxide reductase with GAF domain
MTDTALSHLDAEDLVATLLARVREQLHVDTATVFLLDPYGQELLATSALGLEEEVAQGVRLQVGRGFAGAIAATRQARQLEHVEPSTVLSQILVERGISSVLGVPMIAAGDLVGVLHVGSLAPRRFTDDEVNLLQVAADRMAMATRARQTQLDRATTVALQRSLLPARQFAIDGFKVAARYVPGEDEGVGGDWYDAFRLPSGHVGVVIGDVAGHGLRSAVVMGRIRSALRAYALESHDPADVLSRLDRKISIFEPEALATVLYAVISPDHDRVMFSTAGHPPPILAEPGRTPTLVNLPVDLPLGVLPANARRVTEESLPPGTLLLVYTDGLVERRGEPIDGGIERLRQTVMSGDPETVCARAMSVMVGAGSATDDIALLAITHAQPGAAEVRITDLPTG